MNTLELPPNHELLPPDFLRQHGAVKGMKFWMNDHWEDDHEPCAPMDEIDFRFPWCAPIGTVAAATTPVPEGGCECCEEECRRMEPDQPYGPHHPHCPAHPRNAYVHILPHLLAQLPEKPEGLQWSATGTQGTPNWEPGPICAEFPWDESEWDAYGNGDFAFCLPRHVMDRIEQQLSTKGGDEPCSNGPNESKTAAPERSQPSQEAAHIFYERVAWWVQHNAPYDNWWKVTLEQFRPAAMKEDGK